MALRILLIEDMPSDAKLVAAELRRAGLAAELERVEDAAGLRAALDGPLWDAVISDWSLPGFSALGALEIVRGTGLDLPFIIVSGTAGETTAVEAMRAGAHDYVLKDQLARLAPAIEREVREAALRRAHRQDEHRFRALIDRSTDAIVLSGPDGLISYASPASAVIFGVPCDRLVGRRGRDFIHPDDRALAAEAMAAVIGGTRSSAPIELRMVSPDNTIRWVSVIATNLLEDFSVRAVVSNLRDVTERRHADDALRTSEARFNRLAESGIIAIATCSLDGTILDANEAYASMMGYTRAELIGLVRWTSMIPTDQEAVAKRGITQLLTTGVNPPFEISVLRKDGTRVPVLIGVAMVEAPVGIVFLIDLTERKRGEETLRKTEESLRHAQKMEAVGRLAGGVAHDFNNVLSVILGYADMLLADLVPGDSRRDDVQEIYNAGRRAADLTRQLLMFSRQQVLAPRSLDLNDVMTGMDKMLYRVLGEDIELTVSKAPGLSAIVADPSSIEQVIMNLVVNARDAMPTGGKLTIETANLVFDDDRANRHLGTKPGRHVMLAVTDTGTGMDEATQARIFEPFFTTKDKDKGTGLGLSTVFGIVAQSGGTVWVYSELGVGTTFKIYLPATAQLATTTRQLPKIAARGVETILLVEDEAAVRSVARGILQRHGYCVLEAPGAADAIVLCAQHAGEIHLLLTDVVMPQMSGPELAKRLVLIRPDLKVLCMSGYTDDSIVRHGILHADIAFLQKPLTTELLTRKVRDVLDGDRLATGPGSPSQSR